MKKVFKKGFSLSEVLLTLVIVGMIAAVLGPVLMSAMPDKYLTLYKKSYQSFLSAIRYSIADKTLYVSQTPIFWADTTIDPNTSAMYIGPQDFCKNIAMNLSTVGTVDCSVTGNANSPNFKLVNGSSWWGLGNYKFTTSGGNQTNVIYVDLDDKNGKNTVGIDQLRMKVDYEGKVTTDPTWTTENGYLIK